jgi:4-hydroxybenzoate polyprenyltransferase
MQKLITNALLAMRPHQWVKNILIFAPLILSFEFLNIELIIDAILAFFAFSLTASGLYIVNDLLDIEADRVHPTKRNRPFASGRLSKSWGVSQSIILLVLAFGIARYLNPQFLVALLIYAILSASYSLKLKQIVLLDVSILAVLYTLRIIAGTFAVSLDLSYWLIVFSIFVFTSLAMVKRVSELYNLKLQGKEEVGGRGYTIQDHEIMSALGAASGFVSVLVLALYIHDPLTAERYSHPQWLWMIVPSILYWIGRIWIIAHRGQMNEDPVVFAVRDKVSYLILFFIAIGVYLSI